MKKIECSFLFVVLVLFFVHGMVLAKVRMPSVFTDNMVLQQNSKVRIWGWAEEQSNVSVSTSWDHKSYTARSGKDGKWSIEIGTPAAGGPYKVTISDGTPKVIKNVLIGEVWLCAGQSNMEMPVKGFPGQPVEGSNMDILTSSNPELRLITVKRSSRTVPQDDFEGSWEEASPQTVSGFSATAYYFGSMLQKILNVPVGLINVSYGGSCIQAWMSKETSVSFEDKKVPEPGDSITVPNRTPTVLFNGMLHPVIGYGIKGCIWYQGETNYIEPDRYEQLFPAMVNEWRTLWGMGDFPFYYAQIAPFDYSVFTPTEFHEKYNSAYLRDAQRKCLAKIPNSGMVVLMDIGEKDCIHPEKKKVTGNRFALLVLGDTYGVKGIGYKNPSYGGMEIQGSNVIISFNDVPNGITSFGHDVNCFEIAGEDKHFYPATVFLRRKSVILSSPNVNNPVAVRYAFRDFVVGDLFGTDGLPVPSFRTDNW